MIPLTFLLTAVALFAQDKDKYPKCQVVLIDNAATLALLDNLPANATPEQINAIASKSVRGDWASSSQGLAKKF